MKEIKFQLVAVADLVRRPQPRVHFDEAELESLMQSIRENGILQPLLVHREAGAIVLDDGHRRLEAAMRLGHTEVPVVISEGPLSEPERLQLQLVVNCQRSGLSPIEESRAIAQLIRQTGWSAAQASLKLGRSAAQVSKLLTLLVLPESVQTAVASGRIAMSTAYELVKIPEPTAREALMKEAVEFGLTREQLLGKLKAPVAGPPKLRQPQRTRPERVRLRVSGGGSIIVTGPDVDLHRLLLWLEQCLSRLRSSSGSGATLAEVVRDWSVAEPAGVTP